MGDMSEPYLLAISHFFYHLFLGDRTNEKVIKNPDVVWVIRDERESDIKSGEIK
jgi:hypothetical protein